MLPRAVYLCKWKNVNPPSCSNSISKILLSQLRFTHYSTRLKTSGEQSFHFLIYRISITSPISSSLYPATVQFKMLLNTFVDPRKPRIHLIDCINYRTSKHISHVLQVPTIHFTFPCHKCVSHTIQHARRSLENNNTFDAFHYLIYRTSEHDPYKLIQRCPVTVQFHTLFNTLEDLRRTINPSLTAIKPSMNE